MKYRYTTLSLAMASSLLLTPNLSTAEGLTVLEEIVVTARKQNESLVDTPVAVSVIGAEFFEQTGFNSMADIVKFVPGFDYFPTNPTRANGTRIRGISTLMHFTSPKR